MHVCLLMERTPENLPGIISDRCRMSAPASHSVVCNVIFLTVMASVARYMIRAAVLFLTAAFVSSVFPVSAAAAVRNYRLKVVREYPHDTGSYTQGLFIHDGQMYESTGQYGLSTFRKVDISSGEPLRRLDFSRKYFVEGSAVLGDDLYILTWTNRVAFIYDINTLEYKATKSYPRQGWGLTADGSQLIASDGSASLYFMTPRLQVTRTLTVRLSGRPVRSLNELEYIGGKIWANVYTSDLILIINPDNGNVEGTVDCTGLLPDSLRTPSTDVLNGIAYDRATDKIYLTGKNWPRLYEVVLEEK